MSDRKFVIGANAQTAEESRPLLPYSKVVIYAGNDQDGNEIKFEAGEETGRTLEIENPWGTQAMADNILETVRGYIYQPFSASSVLVPDDAELGDGISVGDTYSVLAEQDIVFDALSASDIGAPGEDETDNEFGSYQTSASRELDRRFSGMETRFTIEQGKIQSYIRANYETIDSANNRYTNLQSTITQTANSILQQVSADYITKEDAEDFTTISDVKAEIAVEINSDGGLIRSYVAGNYINNTTGRQGIVNDAKSYTDARETAITASYESAIEQKAYEITSTVAGAVTKYEIPANVTIDLYGYGPPSVPAASYRNNFYLDQSSGYYWKSDGSRWVRQNNSALPTITDNLKSLIQQSSDEISMEVSSDALGRTNFVLRAGTASFETGYFNMTVNSAYIKGELIADSIISGSTIEAPRIKNGYMGFYNERDQLIGSIQERYNAIHIDAENGVWIESLNASRIYSLHAGSDATIDFSNAEYVIMPDGTTFYHP